MEKLYSNVFYEFWNCFLLSSLVAQWLIISPWMFLFQVSLRRSWSRWDVLIQQSWINKLSLRNAAFERMSSCMHRCLKNTRQCGHSGWEYRPTFFWSNVAREAQETDGWHLKSVTGATSFLQTNRHFTCSTFLKTWQQLIERNPIQLHRNRNQTHSVCLSEQHCGNYKDSRQGGCKYLGQIMWLTQFQKKTDVWNCQAVN